MNAEKRPLSTALKTLEEETFQHLVAEFRASYPQLRLMHQTIMERKFARHYRRMLPMLLENLQFQSNNRFQPVIDALALIQKYFHTHHEYFAEQVPLDGIVTPKWHEKVFDRPNKKEDRGLWALAKLEAQPEPQGLGLIKEQINNRFGVLDLLDVFHKTEPFPIPRWRR
jgi:hypothetical protein